MSRPIRSYKDLLVWQKGVDLAVDLYAVTRGFPASERYGMSSQIQRSGVSIPSNIAEGHAKSTAQYLNHLSHAKGSLCEVETLLIVGNRVGFVKTETFRDLTGRTDELGRMLRGLATSVGS
jgi:four helix bundle protein